MRDHGVDTIDRKKRDNITAFVEKTRERFNYIGDNSRELKIDSDIQKRAQSLFLERAFAIRTRALGISSNFQKRFNMYERELNIYAELYFQRAIFEKENPEQEFDEIKYLSKYPDFVKIHMPFSKTRESQIQEKFEKSGVFSQIQEEEEKSDVSSQLYREDRNSGVPDQAQEEYGKSDIQEENETPGIFSQLEDISQGLHLDDVSKITDETANVKKSLERVNEPVQKVVGR